MPDSPPPQRPRTILQRMTQFIQTVQGFPVSKLRLKVGAQVPELEIQDPTAQDPPQRHPLLGEYYTLGRSSRAADIVVRNIVVSQRHLSLRREVKGWASGFRLDDENSTNGIFWRKRRIKSLVLRHGDVLTLGPAELETAVQIRYLDPPSPIWLWLKRGLYGVGGLTGVILLGVVIESLKINVYPLPVGVQGPVAIYAGDEITPLSPLRTRAHQELEELSEYSPFLPKAVIASEDSRFYWHVGVDPLGIVRAVLTNIRSGELREGASTITQQLARSLFRDYVGTADSSGRKLREMVVALKLETFYSKDFLLLHYLNRVYLGSGLYGFEDAAQFYFGKSARNLTLSEAATLAGILPAPNRINPVRDYALAVEYRDRVIERMVQQGWVSPDEGRKARRSRIEIDPRAQEQLQSTIAPYYYDAVFEELDRLLGEELAQEGNFIVQTGLDPALQRQLETTLKDEITTTGAQLGFSQGAVVTLDASTGKILALAGGVDYSKSQFNRVTQAQRQPGSTFKIFTYLAALEKGISPYATYSCAPVEWQGQSFEGCGSGEVDLPRAVAQSMNAVALRVAQDVGLDTVIQLAQRMGIQSRLQKTPGLVLGQSEVTPLEITGSFAAIANQGQWNPPHLITRILDSSDCKSLQQLETCRVIFDDQRNRPPVTIVPPSEAATMTDMLRGVVRSGTGRAAAIGVDAAGKTGTTNDSVDLWFIGYLPQQKLVTGVWLGNDDNKPTQGSSAQAARLWGRYMQKATRNNPS
jgi:penicillin-binding protein 1A